MSKKPETLFEERVVKRLAELPESWFTKIQAGSIRGLPDRMGVIRGRMVALELKTDRGRVSKLQMHNLKKITQAGGYAAVLRPNNLELVMADLYAMCSAVS